jgi:hypothetical protein
MTKRTGLGAMRGSQNIGRMLFGISLLSTTWPASFLALFFPQLRVFNNFSALFFGLFLASYVCASFVFNNFSGSFLKKGILFYFSASFCVINARRRPPEADTLKTSMLA